MLTVTWRLLDGCELPHRTKDPHNYKNYKNKTSQKLLKALCSHADAYPTVTWGLPDGCELPHPTKYPQNYKNYKSYKKLQNC
jgi:hypothetical protein